MRRAGRYTIVAVILLVLAAVWGKVLLTTVWIQFPRSMANEERQAQGRWERGWPLSFQTVEVLVSRSFLAAGPPAPQWNVEPVSTLKLLLNVAHFIDCDRAVKALVQDFVGLLPSEFDGHGDSL